jgi:large subunit ribosomal protein L22
MEAVAHLRFARISVRKARVILDLVRGQNVAEALDHLRFTRKAAAPIVGKLLGSAIANAQQRDKDVKLDALYVKRAWADKAPGRFMVRWRPRAQGRATPVQKGVTHLTVVIDERAAKPRAAGTKAGAQGVPATPAATAASAEATATKAKKAKPESTKAKTKAEKKEKA